MRDWRGLAHSKLECKYYVMFVSKYRHKGLFGKSRRQIVEILRDLCRDMGIEFTS